MQCSGKNLWCLLSFKFFHLLVEASSNYKLIIILLYDTFPCIFFTRMCSQYRRFARYDLRILVNHYVSHFNHTEKKLWLCLHAKIHIPSCKTH
jgi:hypothetical protein